MSHVDNCRQLCQTEEWDGGSTFGAFNMLYNPYLLIGWLNGCNVLLSNLSAMHGHVYKSIFLCIVSFHNSWTSVPTLCIHIYVVKGRSFICLAITSRNYFKLSVTELLWCEMLVNIISCLLSCIGHIVYNLLTMSLNNMTFEVVISFVSQRKTNHHLVEELQVWELAFNNKHNACTFNISTAM